MSTFAQIYLAHSSTFLVHSVELCLLTQCKLFGSVNGSTTVGLRCIDTVASVWFTETRGQFF